jgi:tRNA nucleotidyltransferase/poly(A) polymerase
MNLSLSEILKYLKFAAKKSHCSQPFIVGGIPRDHVAKNQNKFTDIDITTGDRTVTHLANEFSKLINTPLLSFPDHHTSISLDKFKIDFSSHFISSKISEYENIKDNDLLSEIYSRDFTCNTLLLDLDLSNIQDLTGLGIDDINDKILRTCLDPDVTFNDDYNRIIRVVYLATKLDFKIDKSILNWVKVNAKLIENVEEKYLYKMLKKSFKYSYGRTLRLLYELNLLPFVKTDFIYV